MTPDASSTVSPAYSRWKLIRTFSTLGLFDARTMWMARATSLNLYQFHNAVGLTILPVLVPSSVEGTPTHGAPNRRRHGYAQVMHPSSLTQY